MPRSKATSRSACSESFGKMYVLAVNPSPRNPMGSTGDDWVQDGFVDPFGCIMFHFHPIDLGVNGEASGVC